MLMLLPRKRGERKRRLESKKGKNQSVGKSAHSDYNKVLLVLFDVKGFIRSIYLLKSGFLRTFYLQGFLQHC